MGAWERAAPEAGAREGGRVSLRGSAGRVGLPRGARGQRGGSPPHNPISTMSISG